jgi:hypothetical protein
MSGKIIPLAFEKNVYIRYKIKPNAIEIVACSRKPLQNDLISRVVRIPERMTLEELGEYISKNELKKG